jgi:diguanylate cyclase (GGDEF)-like protein
MHARREARTDDLTGLANRRELYTRLESLLGDGSRPVALLLFDLDGFKELNDALGHHAGDELLKELAVRLHRSLPQADLLVRLGGDEFVALLTPAGHNEAIAAGTAIRELLGSSFRLGSTDVHVQASIGIALAPEHGHTRTALLMHADVAMYRAKRSGTGVEVHDATVRLPDADHLQLASDLHGAIPEGQLAVYFQPKADLATGRLTGAEALIRWLHPERGLLGPDAFLPLAERHGLMHELTATVLDEALAQQAAWRASGVAIPVSVNLARASLLDDGFPTSVAAALERHGATPADLILEITEDTVMVDADRTLAVLDGLRALGVSLALDDFGTGHSSLAYVKRLPIDELKIDKSFVRSMTSDHRDEAIVEAAARLGLRFGMRVVAEGVEDPATWARLKALGCHEAQGFLLARPMPAAAFLAFARDHGAAQAA